MKIFLKRTTLLLLIATITMICCYAITQIVLFKTLSITFAITFYHFAMRLCVGLSFQRKFNNNISYKYKWFRVGEIEMDIYKAIKVKSWKKHVPTYDGSFFDIKSHSYEQILMAMCQAELVHETIMVLSFLPIIACVWFDSVEIFITTSIISALVDLTFVILQRYNRPRILKIMQRNDSDKTIF